MFDLDLAFIAQQGLAAEPAAPRHRGRDDAQGLHDRQAGLVRQGLARQGVSGGSHGRILNANYSQ
jgi:hypothetical protein